ncbi:stage II sporulation protein M [Microbacterium esteraromaticum]|uniref:stage II sporulation protein M n=1 Tax=Microbacterium esteraromaticum TaxID=57043 RepID=UPI002367EC03|nr:stage II sporulation protein M [Microbacterium esteraromaticum]WDH79838.1 stage II sporulation protein M [Microbacterium esteraromaticum]
MDADALADARRPEWERLDELSRRRRLSGAEVDELIVRYRAASADLAELKTSVGTSPQGDYLSTILATARLRFTGAGDNVIAQAARFFTRQLPAALYRIRWTTGVIAVLFVLIGALTAAWIASDPSRIAALGAPEVLQQYAEEDFVEYYEPMASFAGMVWFNNAWIAMQCVLFGVTGLWPIWMLVQNAVGLGVAAAVMAAYGHLDTMILHILPHGLLELTAIFVAAAAGLHVFWAWAVPGPRSRGRALASEGRALATVAMGLIFVLLLSGLVEGFITGSALPWPVKIGIGALALAVFLVYMLVIGRRAARQGESGDLVEYEAGTPTLTAG